MTFDPAKIAIRRREIGEELARLREECARLQQEDQELEIAQRVVQRLGSGEAEKDRGLKGQWTPRPDGTPSIFDMVDAVLSDAEMDGKDSLSPTELVEEIRRRFWPGLSGKQILPSVYQFARAGRLHKASDGNLARLKAGGKLGGDASDIIYSGRSDTPAR